jgi:integrase
MSGASRLRHSCGYKLANDGIDTRAIEDWLGHVSITHTTRHTPLVAFPAVKPALDVGQFLLGP